MFFVGTIALFPKWCSSWNSGIFENKLCVFFEVKLLQIKSYDSLSALMLYAPLNRCVPFSSHNLIQSITNIFDDIHEQFNWLSIASLNLFKWYIENNGIIEGKYNEKTILFEE